MVKRRKRSNAFEQFSGDSKRFRNESILHQDDTENSVPENKPLYGREKEVALLEKPLHEGIVNRSPASIFVSGPPGTGKTLAVKTVLQHILSQHNVHSIYINCASEDTEWDILTVMLNSYNKSSRRPPGKKLITEFHKVLAKMNKHTIIVLDEIDYIRPKDRGSLCSMFQWPFLYDNVSVIGIANTLDTMELLKHKLKSVPVLIVFAPYTEVQLQLILSKKLKNNKVGDAIELCARKVAAITGDARKALQVARRSLSIDLSNGNTSCRNVFGTLTSVYGSPMLQAKIPLQQKILLATMLRLVGDNSSTTVEKSCLLSTYKKLCEFLLLPALEMDEIHEALSLLESQSILKLKSSSYQLLVDKAAAGKLIADSSLISQINTARLTEKMRPLSDEETEIVFKKLAHYIGNHVRSLIEREDAAYCFRLHKDRVYYCTETLMRKAACISREPLLSFGTCLGKFTKTKKFRMHITALDYIAPYAKCKIWVKPSAEQQFLYGNNILKSGMNRMTEGVGSHQGVVVYNMNDLPLGFGVTAKSTTECRRADLTSIVVLHQADLGEYIRNEAMLI